VVVPANTHDMKAAKDTLDSVITQRPLKQQNLCLDKGYDYLEIEIESIKRRYIPHIRHRGENKELIKHGKYYPKRRWVVVERTNPWHNRFRKLLVRYEKKSENYMALVSLACCIIIYRRIVLG
jgi:transposase